MLDVQITIDVDEIEKKLGRLASRAPYVLYHSINDSIGTGKKAIRQETAKVYLLRAGDVDRVLKIKKANASKLFAELSYKDSHKNLYHFGAKTTSTLKPRTRIHWSGGRSFQDKESGTSGVVGGKPNVPFYSGRIERNSSYKKFTSGPKPFIQVGKGGGLALMQRKSNARNAKLKGVYAPAYPQIIKNDKVLARFSNDTNARMQKRIAHYIDQVVKGNL